MDGDELTGLSADVSSDFMRRTTIVHLRGGGHEGTGEDTTYSEAEQLAFQQAGTVLPVTGSHTIESFSALFEGMDSYRRWAVESAALDLALRQAGKATLGGARARPEAGHVRRRRCGSARLRRSTASSAGWSSTPRSASSSTRRATGTRSSSRELAETGAVDSVDLKGQPTRGRSSISRRTRACTAWWSKGFRTHGSRIRR